MPNDIGERMTLEKFASKYKDSFPKRFVVCKGFYGPTEDLKFSEGNRFKAHSLKKLTTVNVEHKNGKCENIPVDSTRAFSILYNPKDNINEAIKGYKYEKVSDLVQLSVLPPVLWSRKPYQGSSPNSSLSANELLIVRRVKSRLMGKQQLKVYSLAQKKEKTLYTSCVGSFSTKPHDVSLHLSDILKYMPDIFPCRAVMFNSEGANHLPSHASSAGMDACVVTLMHSTTDISVTVSSGLGECFETGCTKFTDVPINLGILVRKDSSLLDDVTIDDNDMYEDASLYNRVDQSNRPPQLQPGSDFHDRQLQPISNECGQSQFYTNVNFGCGAPARTDTGVFSPVRTAFEEGHYQTPCSRSSRTSSDPIAIDSIYHPPNDAPPGNYVLMSKGERGGSVGSGGSSGSGGGIEKEPSSWERSSPKTGVNSGSPLSTSYRPPLPPPNRARKSVSCFVVVVFLFLKCFLFNF